jgi:hypothetical protein
LIGDVEGQTIQAIGKATGALSQSGKSPDKTYCQNHGYTSKECIHNGAVVL